MDCKIENLMITLDDEIEKKCFELKKKKQDQKNARLFACACALFIMVPIILMFAGINMLLFFFPIVFFFAFSLFILSPIILNNAMGGSYNEEF